MGAVHLRVMELEGNRQIIPEPFLFVSAPDDKGIIENAAVHPDGSVNLRIDNRRRAYDHAVLRQVPVPAGSGCPGSVL